MNRTPAQLMTDALAGVESESVRAWAKSEKNAPIFCMIARNMLEKYGDSPNTTTRMTIVIVSNAIGL